MRYNPDKVKQQQKGEGDEMKLTKHVVQSQVSLDTRNVTAILHVDTIPQHEGV
jgi:hypothetical protein